MSARIAAACALLVSLAATSAHAQLAAPNAAGVAMGHLHYVVRDVDANRRFWVALGGTASDTATAHVVAFPDVLVFLSQGESSGGTAGSVVNHVAFKVRSLKAVEAAGLKVTYLTQFPGVASVTSPEGERIELFDETSENLVFTLDPGQTSAAAGRHQQKMTTPIVVHHIHFYVPAGSERQAKEWYTRVFGGATGKRWHYEATDLPGINLNFSDSDRPVAPTRGRMLDHIGFEITDLRAFCRKLQAGGIQLDLPYTVQADGVATARLTDPWGTSIELTEGLRRQRR
ncbi:MAG TPA: VOC family protein [Vicinamibacterales bacterium]|nr:VOC family protein [Vicinamibacterales bacterium]